MRCTFFYWSVFFLLGTTLFGSAVEKADYRKLVERYAPVIYQEAHSIKLDQITRFDYDGNENGADNWANAYLFSSPAYVYYAVIEGDRHYFLYYAFYHMRDYTTRLVESYAPKIEHENDMEGVVLLVPKTTGAYPLPIYMETLAHDRFYKYSLEGGPSIVSRIGKPDGPLSLDEAKGNDSSQPRKVTLFIEAEGHGVYALQNRFSASTGKFPGFIYRCNGRRAEEPEEIGDADVAYELLPIEQTLWARRLSIGPDKMYCCGSSYEISGARAIRIGSSFNGPIGGCAAKPPWGWDQKEDGDVRPGEWFFNPIYALAVHVEIPDFSKSYAYNPFYSDGQTAAQAEDCLEGTSSNRSVGQSALETMIGIGQVILSGGKIQNAGTKAREMFLKNMDFLEWNAQPEMSRWQFLNKSLQPIFEAKASEGRTYRTRFEIRDSAILNSPLFNAPARYYRELVFRYRLDRPLNLALGWQYADQSAFGTEQVSPSFSLSAGREWKIFRIPLSELKKAQAERDISRWQLQFTAAQAPTLLELQYIVFDRGALSETFRKEN